MLPVWQNLLRIDNSKLDFVLNNISQAFGCVTKEETLVKFRLILKDLKIPVPQLISKNDIQQLTETVNVQRLENHPTPLSYIELRLMYENIFNSSKG